VVVGWAQWENEARWDSAPLESGPPYKSSAQQAYTSCTFPQYSTLSTIPQLFYPRF